MNIDAKLVKTLRDKTGAGMMDCKKALVESEGDLEKAVDHLRKSGIAKAEKKGSRDTREGLIYSYIHSQFYLLHLSNLYLYNNQIHFLIT